MESPEERKEETSNEEAPDRRAAMKAIARYAAYTAPTIGILMSVNADDALATGRRRRRRKKKKGKPSKGS